MISNGWPWQRCRCQEMLTFPDVENEIRHNEDQPNKWDTGEHKCDECEQYREKAFQPFSNKMTNRAFVKAKHSKDKDVHRKDWNQESKDRNAADQHG